MNDPTSWILQVRHQLDTPPPERLPAGEERPSAVLVPLYVDAGQLWTLLTQRADDLPHHPGQIAFPGGGLEPGESAWDAALRETEEELKIQPATVMRLGQLDELRSPTGYRIVPCVGAVPFPLQTNGNTEEIAEVFSVPLLAFADPRLVEDRQVLFNGVERMVRIYHIGSRQIWGLTARIIQNLLERLGLPFGGAGAAQE